MKLPHTILNRDSKLCPRIVQLNKEIIKGQLKELVRSSVEEALIEMYLARCSRTPDTSAARCISTAMFSLLCPNPRSKLWQKCSRRSTPREQKASREKAKAVVAELRATKLKEAAKKVEDGIEETLTYCDFPSEHWTRIRTNNVIERLNREIRRRTRVMGTFPDGNSALMLVCARLRHVAGTQWGCKKYMNMKHLGAALDDASIAG